MQANVADVSTKTVYALQNCSSMTLRVFTTLGTLEFVQRIPLKDNTKSFIKAYLGTMKRVFVGKAFKKVAVEQTQFKQIKR